MCLLTGTEVTSGLILECALGDFFALNSLTSLCENFKSETDFSKRKLDDTLSTCRSESFQNQTKNLNSSEKDSMAFGISGCVAC